MAKRNKQKLAGQTAVIYARYSSSAQNDASIEQQVDACQRYAKAKGLTILETYSDRAMSGRSDKRPDFQRMMKDAQKGKFACVIAWKSSRMGRNMLEAMLNDAKLADCGVHCLYVEEDFDDTAAGRFSLRTMMNVNQFHSENMAEDIYRGLMDNAKQCKVNGSIPMGYRRAADGRFAIDEEKAAIIREIFDRIARGEIQASIAADLNARGITTKTGGSWGKNSFHNILNNERYTGVYIYGDTRVEGGVPAIVSRDLFVKAQERVETMKTLVKSRRRRDNVDYLLTGKLFCGHCRTAMVGTSGTSKLGSMYYYYRCNNQAVAHTCDKKPVRKEKIERLVTVAIRDVVLTDENISWLADTFMRVKQRLESESDLGFLEEKLRVNGIALGNIMRAIEQGIITESTKARLEELEAEKREINGQIQAERRMIPTFSRENVVCWLEGFKEGDVEDKSYQKKLIKQFLRAVYLFDDHLHLVFDYNEEGEGFDITLPEDIASEELGAVEGESVLISPDLVYQNILIRTPTLRNRGRVFLLSFYFEEL